MKSRKLYRSKEDRIIAGVCGGFADFLSIDSTIVRLIFVALSFALGLGLMFYLVAAMIIPVRHKSSSNYNVTEVTGYEIKDDYQDYSKNYYDTSQESYSNNRKRYDSYGNYNPDKKLCRSNRNKIIGGLCGGIGEYFGIDPTIIRVAFLLLAFVYGGGIIIYVIGYYLVPERVH